MKSKQPTSADRYCPHRKPSIHAGFDIVADSATGVCVSLGGSVGVEEREREGGGVVNNSKTRAVTSFLPGTRGVGSVGECDALVVILPWPPRDLSPNARHAHWSQLARAKKRYRAACALQAKAQGAGRMVAERLSVRIEFVPPDRRHRDTDNMVASLKAGLDGLADVLGVDDARWQLVIEPVAERVGGFVRVEVVPC